MQVMASGNLSSMDNDSSLLTEEPQVFGSTTAIVASASFIAVVMLLTLAGNSLVCFSIYHFHKLRSPTNYIICSLAVADLLVGSLSLPFRLAQTLNKESWPVVLGVAGCQFWVWIDMVCCGASIMNLMGISIDRLLAIARPFAYYEKMTKRRAFIMIGCMWCFALVTSSLQFLPMLEVGYNIAPQCSIIAQTYVTVMTIAAFLIPLIVLVTNYAIVLKIAITHATRMHKEREMIATNFIEINENGKCNGDATRKNKKHKMIKNLLTKKTQYNHHADYHHHSNTRFSFIKQLKATKTLAIVVGVFVICWFPFFVIFLVFQFAPQSFRAIPKAAALAIRVIFVEVLPVSNSAANPIIYSCFNADFRTAFLRLFYKLMGKTQSEGLHSVVKSTDMTSNSKVNTPKNTPRPSRSPPQTDSGNNATEKNRLV